LDLLPKDAVQIEWVGRDTPWGHRNGSTSAHLAKTYPQLWGQAIIHNAPVSAAEVSCRQSAALFNLVPSTWDVFNFTAIEAMASGRPTIVSTGAGASELIEDGVNGYTFPNGDAEALAAKIDCVLASSPAHLTEIGKAAQDSIRHRLNPATVAAERLVAYRSTIEQFPDENGSSVHSSIQEICRATEISLRNDGAFLDQLPTRLLARHVIERVSAKVLPPIRVQRKIQ
jgi:hypothetical protein